MKINNKLPIMFNTYSEARKKGFIDIKNLKDQGKIIVGIFCTYTPVEIILAAGAYSVGLCSTSDETIPDAQTVLPRNLCPLVKSSYGFAMTDKCPYMYFSDLVVGETTCDAKKKMYELLADIKNVHILQLPQNQVTPESKALWYREVLKFKERLENDFCITITDEDLKNAIKIKNRERQALKQFYNLPKLSPTPISGKELLQVLYGSQYKFDEDIKYNEIMDLVTTIKTEYELGLRQQHKDKLRILVTGCPIGGVTEKVVDIIESCGGVVVAYENCIGTKKIDELINENEEPIKAIAERYLNIGCSIMTPNPNRYKMLKDIINDFNIDAVIEMNLQACHTYNIETYKIKEFLKVINIPFLSVETDYSTSDIAQLKTRIGAFLEMVNG